MSDLTISIDQFEDALRETLDEYNKNVVKISKQKAKESIDKLVKNTKATAPQNRPQYKNKITSKKTKEDSFGVEYTWYVSGSEYRLSHLLEHGHAKRGGGRTKAFHFIQNALTPIMSDYVKSIEEAVKNG